MPRLKFNHFLKLNALGRYFNRLMMLATLLFVAWSFVVAFSKFRDGPLSNERIIAQEQRFDEQTFAKIKTFLDSLHASSENNPPAIDDPFDSP